MGGRLALVVGSECAALPRLGFPGALATELYANLSAAGGWQPATAYDGPVLDPTADELNAAVEDAFAVASAQRATLLISFVGHGVATAGEDFFLLAHDSPELPRSRTAFHLTQGIRESLNQSTLDGLIVLIDACETAQGVQGAAHRWTDMLTGSSGRMELLVASGDGPAYAGCFTRTIVDTFTGGLPLRGENLLPSDLVQPLSNACKRQQPQHLSFASGALSTNPTGDPGLWLVPNVARRRDAVTGRPAAGFVDQLTRQLLLTDVIRERLAEIVDTGGRRLRAVVGPAGSGKSTLMAMLVRPSLVDGLPIAPEYVTAAVFLTVGSSIEAVTGELAAQLSGRVPGFTEAARGVDESDDAERDLFDIEIQRPLARIRTPGRRITIVFDGLDQPEVGTREQLVRHVAELTRGEEFTHVRVILGVREGTGVAELPELAHLHRIELLPPSAEDIAALVFESTRHQRATADPRMWVRWIDALLAETPTSFSAESPIIGHSRTLAGGWLLARLLIEVHSSITDEEIAAGVGLETVVLHRVHGALDAADPDTAEVLGALLAILAAAGAGPVLPIELLESALAQFVVSGLHTAVLRDLVVELGVLVTRSRPGTARESLGIAHGALLPALAAEAERLDWPISDGHGAIAAAMSTAIKWAVENGTEISEQAAEYLRGSGARHYLGHGDTESAKELLLGLETVRPVINRDMYAAWLPSFIDACGLDDPVTLTIRHQLAYWRGRSGDMRGAVAELEAVLTDQSRILGLDDVRTLATRHNLANMRGMLDITEAPPDSSAVGLDDTAVRAIARAITELNQLLTDQRRILGADHPDTLATRYSLAYWHGDSAEPASAAAEYERVLADQTALLGPDHPDTLNTRHSIAYLHGENGDIPRAIDELERLRLDRLRVLGPDHPETLQTRHNIADFHGKSGDLDRAIAQLEQVAIDRERILGADHIDTLTTRSTIAAIRSGSDVRQAIAENEQLLADQQRILGSDHPDARATRSRIFYLRQQILFLQQHLGSDSPEPNPTD
ncbi:tetratricopeptide repeat protein [Nocardia anaemiae]|uniref:tetratricopeptide repeat protein n=1 Tax=Nocardia anaemiae TaxID=263910 RepID=UPI0007A4BCD5|nr:tetratricopeptide repeat protein [Nocardia anaemiae]